MIIITLLMIILIHFLYQVFITLYLNMNNGRIDQLRTIRDERLNETDKYAIQDWVLTYEKKKERFEYRQRLRDISALFLERLIEVDL